MRIDRILQDIEGRHEHEERERVRAVSEDLTRAERAQVLLVDRFRAAEGSVVTVHGTGAGTRTRGRVVEVAPGWVLLEGPPPRRRVLVPLPAIALVEGLGIRSRPAPVGGVPPLPFLGMLRGLARDRGIVVVETVTGPVTGRIAAVGADALDLEATPTGETGPVPGGTRLTIAEAAVLLVRSELLVRPD